MFKHILKSDWGVKSSGGRRTVKTPGVAMSEDCQVEKAHSMQHSKAKPGFAAILRASDLERYGTFFSKPEPVVRKYNSDNRALDMPTSPLDDKGKT